MQSQNKEQKIAENQIWEALGLHLGEVWGLLRPLLGAFGRLLADFWALKIKLVLSIGPRWAPKALLDRFGIDLGRVWADFGRAWEHFGRFGKGFGRI